jgi:Ser/Thr protein kinase RdoA (MazF antagonist)
MRLDVFGAVHGIMNTLVMANVGDQRAVMRFSGPGLDPDKPARSVQVARYLHENGVEVVPPLADRYQPGEVEFDGRVSQVTAWQYIDERGRPDPQDPIWGEGLGGILQDLHTLPPPPGIELPVWDPVPIGLAKIQANGGALDRDIRDWMLAEYQRLTAEFEDMDAARQAIIHRDVHPGNALWDGERRRVVLGDLDDVSVGPPEVDLAVIATSATHIDAAKSVSAQLSRAYGLDVTKSPHWLMFKRLRELHVLTDVLPRLAADPSMRGEVHRRARSLMADNEFDRWIPYSELGGQ